MDLPIFKFGKLYGGPPYLVNKIDPDIVISLAMHLIVRSKNTRQTYHYPIRNLHVEPLYNIANALDKIVYHIKRNDKVFVHCLGGCGRTGTVISAYLILYHGYNYKDAVNEFLRQRGCTIESYVQEHFLSTINYLLSSSTPVSKILAIIRKSITLNEFMSKAKKYIRLT